MAVVTKHPRLTPAPGYGDAGSTPCGVHGWITVGAEPSCAECRILLEGTEPSYG